MEKGDGLCSALYTVFLLPVLPIFVLKPFDIVNSEGETQD